MSAYLKRGHNGGIVGCCSLSWTFLGSCLVAMHQGVDDAMVAFCMGFEVHKVE